jgi:hypothetical protein
MTNTETRISAELQGLVPFLAAHIKKQLDKRVKEYEEDCESWAEQGYRPHYCFHGVNLWTDYDPICGRCEDSDDWRDTEAKSIALAEDALIDFDEQGKAIRDVLNSLSHLADLNGILRSTRISIQNELFKSFVDVESRTLWGQSLHSLSTERANSLV